MGDNVFFKSPLTRALGAVTTSYPLQPYVDGSRVVGRDACCSFITIKRCWIQIHLFADGCTIAACGLSIVNLNPAVIFRKTFAHHSFYKA